MGKDKEMDAVDEALDESFPASDPPAWTPSPRNVSAPTAGEHLKGAARRQAPKIPSNFFLWTGLAVAATSLGLLAAGKRQAGVAVGMWVPSILLAGVYAKLAKLGHAGTYRPDVH